VKVIVHRLSDGRWRVTDAPDDWMDDGRAYPPPNESDQVFEFEADAVRDYLERTTPPEPSDDVDGFV
jgi:hypothetical protein